jgi:hypothetical protein
MLSAEDRTLKKSRSPYRAAGRTMKALLVVSVALLLPPIPSSSAILGPGKYNGVLILDRWDGCHLYTGVFQIEISEKAASNAKAKRELGFAPRPLKFDD